MKHGVPVEGAGAAVLARAWRFAQYDRSISGPSLQTAASAFSEHLLPLTGRCNESSSADMRKNMSALHFDRQCCSSVKRLCIF